jgi:hypothetical protein
MITIVGGTYDESCFEPFWKEKFGSGLRAYRALSAYTKKPEFLEFYTFADSNSEKYLSFLFDEHSQQLHTHHIPEGIKFDYDHPMINPRISPRLDTINKSNNNITVIGENILYFGCIEGVPTVNGNKVVYDPQSPVAPILFSATGSTAKELVYVINLKEAQLLAGTTELPSIQDFFLSKEKADILILKMGPKGALVFDKNGSTTSIPVYRTSKVWPIGSGDIFASFFAHYWFKGEDPSTAANNASRLTATYCQEMDLEMLDKSIVAPETALLINKEPVGQVYLAGPFFTFSQRWLIDQIRTSLLGFNLKVFSPWHDVGHGIAQDVVSKDLEALDSSSLVYAVIDGLDSGTLFEVGYAVKKGIPVIAYVENESPESVKMIEGTNCTIERDLTTSIYRCYWKLSGNE